MESPKRKRISDVKVGLLIVEQVKPAILNGTYVRLDSPKTRVLNEPRYFGMISTIT
jgi:hypothetical protein